MGISELSAIFMLVGMAGMIGFLMAMVLRRDAPTPPPTAAERNLTESFMLERLDSRLATIERGGNISINITIPQAEYRGEFQRDRFAALPEARTPLYLPAEQTRHSLPDSRSQIVELSRTGEYEYAQTR
jgi:hypothetical protein